MKHGMIRKERRKEGNKEGKEGGRGEEGRTFAVGNEI
jgi:hypothetical protein